MIASAILFDRHIALWTLFRVCSDPIWRFRIVITFFDPFTKEATLHGIVPLLTTLKAEDVTALALNRTCFNVLNFYGVTAVSWRTPAQQTIALDKAVGDKLLVLCTNARLCQQIHHSDVIHQNITAMSGACDGLAQSFLHDLCGEVLNPTWFAEAMTTLESSHAGVLVL
jgi:hypothetical protein